MANPLIYISEWRDLNPRPLDPQKRGKSEKHSVFNALMLSWFTETTWIIPKISMSWPRGCKPEMRLDGYGRRDRLGSYSKGDRYAF
jgi:hypothetical protein